MLHVSDPNFAERTRNSFQRQAIMHLLGAEMRYAGFTLFGPTDSVLTVEFKLNLIAPADGECLFAEGRVKKPGRTLTVCEMDVWVEKQGRRKDCAVGLQTLMRVTDRPDIAEAG
jgi:acyl-coenzyme A thioesterase PaaI-like protein